MEIGLISCTKSKRTESTPPRDLYDPSAYFRKARSYAETHHDDWYILSAKYGLLDPDGPAIEPYDETLTQASVSQRREWSTQVLSQLDETDLLTSNTTFVIHAGKAYYGELLPLLTGHPVDIKIPTEGLMFGETLAWYDAHVTEANRTERTRETDIDRLYGLLDELEDTVNGKQKLKDCTGYMDWPDRGIYIFFASDDYRDADSQLRVTRIGTHAVSEGSSTSLWDRLRTHRGANRGTYEGGGNHRGSVFRKRVGEAFVEREKLHDEYPHWGEGSSAKRDRRLSELDMEQRVSDSLRDLPFLWVNIDDTPSADSQRAYIERNMIALLSNYQRTPVDRRSDGWLGTNSRSEKIRESGLWNVNHVDEEYDPAFLPTLEGYISNTSAL